MPSGTNPPGIGRTDVGNHAGTPDAGGVRALARRVLGGSLAVACAMALAGCAGLTGPGPGFPGILGRPVEPSQVGGFALPVERPVLQVGDRWVWSGREAGDRASDDATVIERVVTRVAGERIELRQVSLHPVTRRPTGAAQTRSAKLSTWHLAPNARFSGEIRALVFPLSPGKQWEYEYWLGGAGRDIVTTYHYRARVDGIDTVRTPAGRFETLRVTHEGKWSRPVLEQGRPVERSGDVRTTYWYAPAVGTWVRLEVELRRPDGSRELAIVQELIEYQDK